MSKIKYVASACLAGFFCKYNGGSNPCPQVIKLYEAGLLLPICPESLAGLPAPRPPSEILADGRVIGKYGEDLSAEFEAGAEKAFQKASESGCRKAILKSRSPSCGFGSIYDGSFTGSLRTGNGKWAEKLSQAGFEIWTEENLPPDEEN